MRQSNFLLHCSLNLSKLKYRFIKPVPVHFAHTKPNDTWNIAAGPMKMISLIIVVFCYIAIVTSESNADESHLVHVVSVKQIYNDKIGSTSSASGRLLQTDPSISCSFESHGQAISCVEQTPNNDNIKYSVSCPAGVTIVDQCLQDQKRICYQFNSLPCIGGFYCGATNRFALDCGNLFARSNNNTCSKTDCDVNCAQIRDVPVDYNSVPLDNDCFRLGLSSSTTADIVTTEWTHILADSTIIQVTGTRSSAASVFSTCEVTVRDQAGSSCPCKVDCAPQVNAISYDCTAFSNDGCAAVDCSGNCLVNGFPPPVAAPVSPPVVAPVTAPISPPVNPPVLAPVLPPVVAPATVPVSPPVSQPVTAPVSPPVNPPVTIPVSPPVVAPVTAPVSPPLTAPVSPPVNPQVPVPIPAISPVVLPPVVTPVSVPVNPPVVAPVLSPMNQPVPAPVSTPVSPPVVAPVSSPILSPVGIITSPPVMRPIVVPSSNATICPIWWGLY